MQQKKRKMDHFPKTNCFSFGHEFHGHNRNVYDKFKISNLFFYHLFTTRMYLEGLAKFLMYFCMN